MTKTPFALMLAGTLMVPHITPALGNEELSLGRTSARTGEPNDEVNCRCS
jgi:hypothetical protein